MSFSLQLGLMSLAVSLAGNFQLGYLAAVLSQPYVAIQQQINDSWVERQGTPIAVDTLSLIMSALNIVNPVAQMIGQMVALYICDRIGRKRTALLGCFVIFPGCLLSMASKYLPTVAIELLFIGRLLWSLADGILVVNQTIWLIEAAPLIYRGSFSSMQEVFASVGSLASQAFGVPFSTNELWPLMFVFPMIVNVFCIAIFFIVYESPQYLLFERQAPEEARKAIAAYHNITNKDQIEEQLDIVKMNGASSADTNGKPKVNGMDIMFRPWKANDEVSCVLRYGAWIGVMVKIGTLTGAFLLQTVNVIGLGSLSRFYGAELVPKKLLLKSVSTLAIVEAMIRVVPEFAFYPLAHTIGGYYFLVFIVLTIVFLLLICHYCPETKGKTVNEVLNVMARRKGLAVKFHVADHAKHDVSSVAPQPSDLPIVIAMKQWGITVTDIKPRLTQSCRVRSVKKHRILAAARTTPA